MPRRRARNTERRNTARKIRNLGKKPRPRCLRGWRQTRRSRKRKRNRKERRIKKDERERLSKSKQVGCFL